MDPEMDPEMDPDMDPDMDLRGSRYGWICVDPHGFKWIQISLCIGFAVRLVMVTHDCIAEVYLRESRWICVDPDGDIPQLYCMESLAQLIVAVGMHTFQLMGDWR